MIHALNFLLKTDTVDYLDMIVRSLSHQRGKECSRSDAIEWLVQRDWIKRQKKIANARHDQKVAQLIR